jgi:hypothetical protein
MGFLFDGPLSGGDRFEALVRDCLTALGRETVRPGGKARLRTLDGRELLA